VRGTSERESAVKTDDPRLEASGIWIVDQIEKMDELTLAMIKWHLAVEIDNSYLN
jgi:hypothetical protein